MSNPVETSNSAADAINRVLKQDRESQQAIQHAEEAAQQILSQAHADVTRIERRTEERIARIHQLRKHRLKEALKAENLHFHDYDRLSIGDTEQQRVTDAIEALVDDMLGLAK